MERISEKTFEKYIKAMMDISRAITSELYLEDILKLIVMVTAKVTGVEICSLWLVDKGETAPKLKLKATQAIDPDYVKERSLNMDEGVVGFVATHKTPLVLENVLADKRFKEKDMARKLGLVSMLSVPLMVKNDENRKEFGDDRRQPGCGGHHEHGADGQNQGHTGRAGSPKTNRKGKRDTHGSPEHEWTASLQMASKAQHGRQETHTADC